MGIVRDSFYRPLIEFEKIYSFRWDRTSIFIAMAIGFPRSGGIRFADDHGMPMS